jgi:sec-independent protein translocase protein TatB
MSFSDTVFLFFLALIIFGPKKLPEIARQAGRLLAELRRASNEFKSQIETEIAQLEVEKNRIPPSPPPQGTMASLSANPSAGESTAYASESSATLAAATVEVPATGSSPTAPSEATPTTDAVAEPDASTSQASHV